MKKRQPFILAFILGFMSMPLYDIGFQIAWDGNPAGMFLAFSGFFLTMLYVLYTVFYFMSNDSPYKKQYRLSLLVIPFAAFLGFVALNLWYNLT